MLGFSKVPVFFVSLCTTSLKVQKFYILPIENLYVLYESHGAETWRMTKKEHALLIFERKIFRRIEVLNMKMGNGTVGRIEK